MKLESRAGLLCVATFVVFVLAIAPAGAARRAITGKLPEAGYTVIALAANGKATSVRGRRSGFSLRPPADTVTLHLRGADGVYAGPVVDPAQLGLVFASVAHPDLSQAGEPQ